MAITREDINLNRFLEKCAPQAFPVQGKLTLANTDFLVIASLLKLDLSLEKIKRVLT